MLRARSARRFETIGERAQQLRAVTSERAAVHACEDAWLGRRETIEHRARVLRMRVVLHRRPHAFARLEDRAVALTEWRRVGAGLREEIAAEERARVELEEVATLPRVREMRHVEPTHDVAAERERLAVC